MCVCGPDGGPSIHTDDSLGNEQHGETMMAAEPAVAENGVETRSIATSDAAGSTDAASNPPNPNSFEEQYTLGKMIGSGTFSVVRDAIHKPTGQRYAIKCIKREGLVAEDIEALTTEVAILKQVGLRRSRRLSRTDGV